MSFLSYTSFKTYKIQVNYSAGFSESFYSILHGNSRVVDLLIVFIMSNTSVSVSTFLPPSTFL